MPASALMNVMVGAARKAGRSLARDFGEVEQLQVSLKGPANFVSAADTRAEEILHKELCAPGPATDFLLEEHGEVRGRRPHPPLHRRSARRHHQLPARHPALRHRHRARARRRAGGGPHLQSGQQRDVHRRARQGRLPQRPSHPRRGEDRACRLRHRHRHSASWQTRPGPFLREMQAVMSASAGVRRTGAAALDLAWVAAGRFDGFWERNLRPGISPPASSSCARPAVSSATPRARIACWRPEAWSPATRPSSASC